MYLYDDEDNAPMNDFLDEHNPTVYGSRAEMKAIENDVPFCEPRPENGCWNCMNFNWDKEACTVGWNNLDDSYYNPDSDDRDLVDCCEYHVTDPDADPECLICRGNEP